MYLMMKLVLSYYDKSVEALGNGASLDGLIDMEVRERIGRYKYTEEANIEEQYKTVEKELDNEIAEVLRKGDA